MLDGGRLVLVFDDCYLEDYEMVWSTLRELDATAVFAVVPGWVGRSGHASADQLAEMAEGGCEIAAHGRKHRFLLSTTLTEDVAPEDPHACVEDAPGGDHGFVVGDRYELIDDENREAVELAGVEADGNHRTFQVAGLQKRFEAGATLRPTRDVVADELGGAREGLAELGFEPDTMVFPYDAADVRAWEEARRRYAVVANAACRALPNLPGTSLGDLRRFYLETDHLPRAEIEEFLDSVAQRDGLGVLAGHSQWETVTRERIEWTVRAARERGVDVTTFQAVREETTGGRI